MLVTLDNYKNVLPEKKWNLYLQYVNTPTYTGINGEMLYNAEEGVLECVPDEMAEAMGMKWNTCETWDLHEENY